MRYRPIRRNSEFGRVYARGKSYVNPGLVMYVLKTRSKKTRVGLTATKKIGHAVQRNRARRVMKAAIDEHLDYNIGGYDLIFVARGMTPRLKSWQLSSVVAKLFAQAGLPDKAKQPGAKPPPPSPPAAAPEGEGALPGHGPAVPCACPSAGIRSGSARDWGATAVLPPPAASMPSRPSRPTAASRGCCWPLPALPGATRWAAGATTPCRSPAAGATRPGSFLRPDCFPQDTENKWKTNLSVTPAACHPFPFRHFRATSPGRGRLS